MARQDLEAENDEELLDAEQTEEGAEAFDPDDKRPLASGFIISIAAHCVVLFLFTLVVLVGGLLEEEAPPVRVASIQAPPKKEEPKLEREINDVDLPLDVPSDADKPSPINQLDVPIEEAASSEDDVEADVRRGREEAVADSEMGGSGAFMAIGAGGGSSGMFGSRNGGGKKRALGKYGGSRGSESAVDAALRWFKKHQSANGQWDVDAYQGNCGDGAKCEPGTEHTDASGDIACTGYAILCFLGAGYDHRMPSKYKATVKKAIDYLVSVQNGDGSFGEQNYTHAVATMALAEAYAMSNDPTLKDPAQKGVKIILDRQCPDDKNSGYGLGWDYTAPKPTRIDSSVSGWCIMALKSAAAGGLSVGNGMEGAKSWLKKAWEASNPGFANLKDPYKDVSTFPYTYDSTNNAFDVGAPGSGIHEMAPVGALAAVFLGHKGGDMMLESLCNYIVKNQFPATYPTNTYYMYYNTLAIFQAGGERWTKWNDTVRDMLVGAQRRSNDCFDGSWDYANTVFHGHQTGRLLSTAYCCLSLEVYYRYQPVGGKEPAKQQPMP
jgi:hypothetical protein